MPSVRLKFACKVDGDTVSYYAAHPPNFHLGFAGSCLPFADESQAMHNTPNKGTTSVDRHGFADIDIPALPNSYYYNYKSSSKTLKLPPTVHVHFTSRGRPRHITVKVADAIPHRDLFSEHRASDIVADALHDNNFEAFASGHQRLEYT